MGEITKDTGWPMRSLWAHRELLLQFTARGVEERHRGSRLGMAWQVLSPLLMLALYSFTFGLLLNGSFGVVEGETSADYALGIFMGFSLYGLVADCMGSAPHCMRSNVNLVKKVRFPLEILPAAQALAACQSLIVCLALFALGCVLVGTHVTLHLLLLPVIILPVILLGMGLAWLLAAAGVFFRDVANAMTFATTALFYISGIFYSPSSVHAEGRLRFAVELLRLNPVFVAIDLARDVTLWGRAPALGDVAYLYAFSICVFYLGFRVFRRLQPHFADVL
jgi:lipopolysaccharide transport system permease protein